MSVYYTVFMQNTNQNNLERIANILKGQINSFETILKIEDICADKFYELEQLFPFECAKDYSYEPDEEYTFSEGQKKELLLFFEDCDYIICYDDCTDRGVLYSKNQVEPFLFDTCDIRFWEEAPECNKEEILQAITELNIELDELKAIF